MALYSLKTVIRSLIKGPIDASPDIRGCDQQSNGTTIPSTPSKFPTIRAIGERKTGHAGGIDSNALVVGLYSEKYIRTIQNFAMSPYQPSQIIFNKEAQLRILTTHCKGDKDLMTKKLLLITEIIDDSGSGLAAKS